MIALVVADVLWGALSDATTIAGLAGIVIARIVAAMVAL